MTAESDQRPASSMMYQPVIIVPPEQREFGRYQLYFRLATGGMAHLYVAQYLGPDGFEKFVAIKKIHDHLIEDSDFVAMFTDEARIAARISHPNVVQTLDMGMVGKSYFIAMEYVEGESLGALIKRVSIPHPIAARIISEAALGLHAAHELRDASGNLLQVIHRDVSPQNILIGYNGTVKVVDFGVAKAKTNVAVTKAGTVKGKFGYMAPEQLLRDEFGPLDRRADVFSLGILLYEATTRRNLFKGTDHSDTLHKVLYKDIDPPSIHVRNYSQDLEWIVMKALQRNPEDRYQTAHEMHLALEKYLDSTPMQVLPGIIADLLGRVFSEEMEHKAEMLRLCREVMEPSEGSGSHPSTMSSAVGEVQPRARRGLLWTTLSLALLSIGILIYVLVLPGPESQPAAVAPAAKAPGAKAPGSKAPERNRPPAPQMVRVVIQASPKNATITVAGKAVSNPYEIRWPMRTGEVDVTVAAPGHIAQTFKIPQTEGGRWFISLKAETPATQPALKTTKKIKRRKKPRRKKKREDGMFDNPYER